MSYLGRSAKLSLKAQEKVSFLATAGQTSKTGLSYTPSFIEVYVNGVLLTDTTDYTATNGNSITFTVALLLNDEVTVISLKTFTVADHYSKTEADTLLAAKATVANFTSTGIDDNATSTAITIDASEIVTVGSTVSPALKVNRQSANGDAYIELQSNGTKVANLVGSSIGGFSVHTGASGTLTTALAIDNAGRVTKPYQPAFHAMSGTIIETTSTASPAKLEFSSALLNTGGHYSTTNDRFTAPVAGVYKFSVGFMSNSSRANRFGFFKNGSVQGNVGYVDGPQYQRTTYELCIALAVNDYVDFRTNINGTTEGSVHEDYRYFTGYLIG